MWTVNRTNIQWGKTVGVYLNPHCFMITDIQIRTVRYPQFPVGCDANATSCAVSVFTKCNKVLGNSSLDEICFSTLVSWHRIISGHSVCSSSVICIVLPRRLFTFIEIIFNWCSVRLWWWYDFTRSSLLQCTGSQWGSWSHERTPKEFDVDVSLSGELKNNDVNDGSPHLGQIHEQLLFFRVAYMLGLLADTPLHLLWTHASQIAVVATYCRVTLLDCFVTYTTRKFGCLRAWVNVNITSGTEQENNGPSGGCSQWFVRARCGASWCKQFVW